MRTLGRLAVFTILVVLLSHSFTLAQGAEQAEEQRALGFIKAVQAGDADALLAYMQENWAPAQDPEERAQRWQQFVPMIIERNANVTVTGVLAEAEHSLTILAEQPDGPPLRFEFTFEPEPPHRILGFGVEAGGDDMRGPKLPPVEFPSGASNEDIARTINPWLDQLTRDSLFSGTVLIAWQGKPIYTAARGLASIEWNVPNTPDTRFDLGSINKSFTQIAIGQLVDQGKLSFDDKLIDMLPDYPNPEAARKITLRHLLEHSAGLGDIFGDTFFNSSKAQYRQPRDFFPLFANRPLEFEPGSKRSYSNAAYMVLGAIIARVSGQDYDQYVIEHVFKPAGMTHSGFWAADEPIPNIAEGYTRMEPEGDHGPLRSNRFDLPIKGNSAGSAQSTVSDLLKFDNALRDHKLLPPAYTMWYFRGPEPKPGETGDSDAKREFAETGIAGGAPGVSATLESDGRLAVIVLANFDAPITESIARSLFQPLKKVLTDRS